MIGGARGAGHACQNGGKLASVTGFARKLDEVIVLTVREAMLSQTGFPGQGKLAGRWSLAI